MIRPTWATVIGVFMILFGSCGTINNLKLSRSDEMMRFADSLMDNMEEELNSEEIDSVDQKVIELLSDTIIKDSITQKVNLRSTIASMMYITDYYKRWSGTLGFWGVIISLLTLIGGILFFFRSKITIPFAICVIAINTLLLILKIYIFSSDTSSSYILRVMNFSFYASIFIEFIFMLIILVADKSYYIQEGDFDP